MSVSHVTAPGLLAATRAAYGRFVDARRGARVTDPYFGEARVRFEPRDDDVLAAPGEIVAARASCGVSVGVRDLPGRLEVCGVSLRDADAVGRAVSGGVPLGEARRRAAVPAEVFDRIVAAAFGKLLFAPLAVSALEARVSFTEIVRYPGSPYEVVRPYWENQCDVAERLRAEDAPGDAAGLLTWLRSLHVTLLTGRSGQSFYLPASPVVMKSEGAAELVPGELATEPSVTEAGARGTRFVSGLRVNASPIGGATYQALLAESVNDPESLLPEREWRGGGAPAAGGVGAAWGRLVTAQSGSDDAAARWFCPPRPIAAVHVEALCAALAEGLALPEGSHHVDALAPPLARLHQGFVRLHPFRAGNQSLAMSLVNHVVRRALGGGLPHLVLDHLALSLSEPAYAEVFRRALRGWVVSGSDAVSRARELSARRTRAFALLGRVGHALTVDQAREVVGEDVEAARLVFLRAEF